MTFKLPKLKNEEIFALQMRALYEENSYKLFHMGSFEEYDFYLQNKSFLTADDIISFTGADGRLLALKPDVTLSIVKNVQDGRVSKAYYNENVYRRSRQTGEYKEIHQMGLEFIGGDKNMAQEEVLILAAKSLNLLGKSALDLSHMEYIAAMLDGFSGTQYMQEAVEALRNKSPHGMLEVAKKAGFSEELSQNLASLAVLSGEFNVAIKQAYLLADKVPKAKLALEELVKLHDALIKQNLADVKFRLDFSILNNAGYYNGLMFQGFVKGANRLVLAGGRYDNLLQRFDKQQGALGFAVYFDALEIDEDGSEESAPEFKKDGFLNVALPKGRLGNKVYNLFEKAGFGCEGLMDESRKLVFEDVANKVRYFLVKPSDVDIYVEHGAADIGVVGKDVLLESGADVLELLDLNLGKCKIAVAGKKDFVLNTTRPLKVATKYKEVARNYYAALSQDIELIKLHGSIELAPILGLSDVIVDIVETGATLVENDLAVLSDVVKSSARLIVNRASWRFKGEVISGLVQKVGEML